MAGQTVREQVEGTRPPQRRKKTPLRGFDGRAGDPLNPSRQVKSVGQTAGGVTMARSVSKKVPPAELDQFNLLTAGKYRGLGPRCRQNVAIAIRDGMRPTGNAGTTEEMVCYGEFIQRGFEYAEGGPKTFQWQYAFAGSNLDFMAWFQGEMIAIRPMNEKWHGHLDKVASDQAKADELRAAGCTLYDIWDEDSLLDATLEFKFDQWFGHAG